MGVLLCQKGSYWSNESEPLACNSSSIMKVLAGLLHPQWANSGLLSPKQIVNRAHTHHPQEPLVINVAATRSALI